MRHGYFGNNSLSLGLALAAVMLAPSSRRRIRPAPTPEQIAAADKRNERQKWNDEVEARKAAKRAAKEPTA